MNALATAAFGSLVPGCTHSMADMRPLPRASPMTGYVACWSFENSASFSPCRVALSSMPSSSMASMVATPAAQATALPP